MLLQLPVRPCSALFQAPAAASSQLCMQYRQCPTLLRPFVTTCVSLLQPPLSTCTSAAAGSWPSSSQPGLRCSLPPLRSVRGTATQAAARAQPAAPTDVPRNPGVTDGRWDQQDVQVVQEALKDAQEVVSRRQLNKKGSAQVLLGRTVEELAEIAKASGQPAYRGKQLHDGLMHGARSVDDITNVPKALKQQLVQQGYKSGRSVLHHTVTARDGTRKFLLQLHDGRVVETVGIPVDDADHARLTVCVSSQVGCPMRCSFCATGKGGFARNLMPHEIVDQVLTVQEEFGTRVSNVVFMGMGEPLLNLPSVLHAHEMLNKDMGIGARHITISTVGVPNAIMRLAAQNLQSTLAISIHAANQRLREQIIPSAKAYPLEVLMMDCHQYFATTGRRVTFEYTLMAKVNDSPDQAEELALLLKRFDLKSHVNLIPWNPVDETEFQRPSKAAVRAFAAVLERHHVPVSVRITRGLEAAAACGQLRNQHQKVPLESFAAAT